MGVKLGASVEPLIVELARDADFFGPLQYQLAGEPADWPAGTTVELRFYASDGSVEATWTATVAADMATISKDKALVNALIDTKSEKVKLFYTNGGTDQCWAVGRVEVIE